MGCASAQRLESEPTNSTGRICRPVNCYRLDRLEAMLKDCVVVLGNLRVVLLEAHNVDFNGLRFPKLREVRILQVFNFSLFIIPKYMSYLGIIKSEV